MIKTKKKSAGALFFYHQIHPPVHTKESILTSNQPAIALRI
jgi:hypothetical protein